ncbi:hypothetical protein GCM10027451_09380 [Geodermatophilus aquaeductus]
MSASDGPTSVVAGTLYSRTLGPPPPRGSGAAARGPARDTSWEIYRLGLLGSSRARSAHPAA